jgi:hypothetical protein
MAPGCRGGNDEDRNDPTPKESASLPLPAGQALLDYLTLNNDYHQWPLFPGKTALYPGQHPHGALLTTYVSVPTLKALENKTGQLPDGAILVKENYSPQKQLAAVTVMYRRAGYNPASGDWFWLKFTPDGTILAEGKIEGCINCHRAVTGNDWIFTGPVK